MALQYFVRNFPKYAQLSGRYISGNSAVRSASVLASSKYYHPKLALVSATCNDVKPSPCWNKNVDLSLVKTFSITPSKLSATAAAHDHTKLWSTERVVSAALLGIVPVAFVFPSPAMDSLLAVSLVMHNHWGIEAVVIDYVRPIIFGSVIPKIALILTYGLSIATLVGLFYLIFNGSGLVNTIQLFWKI